MRQMWHAAPALWLWMALGIFEIWILGGIAGAVDWLALHQSSLRVLGTATLISLLLWLEFCVSLDGLMRRGLATGLATASYQVYTATEAVPPGARP
jgi:hypothetical protein